MQRHGGCSGGSGGRGGHGDGHGGSGGRGQGGVGGHGGAGGHGQGCCGIQDGEDSITKANLFLSTICISIMLRIIDFALLFASKTSSISFSVQPLSLAQPIKYCIFSLSAVIKWLNAISSAAIDAMMAAIDWSHVGIVSEFGKLGLDILLSPFIIVC